MWLWCCDVSINPPMDRRIHSRKANKELVNRDSALISIEVEMAQPEELWEESWGDEMSVSVV